MLPVTPVLPHTFRRPLPYSAIPMQPMARIRVVARTDAFPMPRQIRLTNTASTPAAVMKPVSVMTTVTLENFAILLKVVDVLLEPAVLPPTCRRAVSGTCSFGRRAAGKAGCIGSGTRWAIIERRGVKSTGPLVLRTARSLRTMALTAATEWN